MFIFYFLVGGWSISRIVSVPLVPKGPVCPTPSLTQSFEGVCNYRHPCPRRVCRGGSEPQLLPPFPRDPTDSRARIPKSLFLLTGADSEAHNGPWAQGPMGPWAQGPWAHSGRVVGFKVPRLSAKTTILEFSAGCQRIDRIPMIERIYQQLRLGPPLHTRRGQG